MLSANQRLPDGNQILAQIMSLLKSILWKRKFLSRSMFRWRFLKQIFNVFFFFCEEILLAGATVPTTHNREFTGKSSLTSFFSESSENKFRLKHHITRTEKCCNAFHYYYYYFFFCFLAVERNF